MSLLSRFTEFKREGRVIHIPGLFYRFDNSKFDCGHIRLFGKPLGGIMIHSWNQMNSEWSKSRVWWFGLFSIIHVDAGPNNELKHTKSRAGMSASPDRVQENLWRLLAGIQVGREGLYLLTDFHWQPWFAWRPVTVPGPRRAPERSSGSRRSSAAASSLAGRKLGNIVIQRSRLSKL
jgi:hypothetical protein